MRATFIMLTTFCALAAASVPQFTAAGDHLGARFISWSDLTAFSISTGEAAERILTSPEVDTGISWDELIVSWNAQLPPEGALRVEARGLLPDRPTRWYTMALWSGDPGRNPRESVVRQKDGDGEVHTDTLVMKERGARAQVRLTLSGGDSARVKFLGLSFVDSTAKAPAVKSKRAAWGKTLEVPEKSQLTYEGGRGWCSPTSTCMALNYWAKRLGNPELAVDVPAVAAGVNDPKWPGTGNWPFNTAYAGAFPGMRAYVTRFADLSEVEEWVLAGVPVIMSVLPRLLTGSDSASNGHLIVGIGFTAEGDLVANDPWARTEKGQPVRRIYKRANAAAAWAASRNTVYLIYPESLKAPKDPFGHWAP